MTTFRLATSEDWTSIASLLTESHLPLDGAQEHIQHFLLAFEGDLLAGVAGLECYAEHALLRSVAVRKQGQGLGKELVSRIIESARSHGITSLVLLTTTAENYFPRFGFTRISRNEIPTLIKNSQEFHGACPDTAIAMRLFLK